MINKNYTYDISAVLVTYNPNIEGLRKTIQAVLNQVSDIFIVDNASSSFSIDWLDEFKMQTNTKLHLLPQNENVGIGAAHNIGIRQAIEQGAKFILLLDQDSQVEADMVFKLRAAYEDLTEKGIQVGTIGPQYYDTEHGILSQFVKIKGARFTFCPCDFDGSIVDTDFIVSSGSLLPVSALDTVGLMDESLFIDLVDTEWCFRAKSKGLQVFGLCGAIMAHSLGEQRKEVYWLFRHRIISFHKPFRYYYMFRNSILLHRRGYVPLNWKIAEIIRCFRMAIFFTCAAEDRWQRFRAMCLGVFDGLRGISGKRVGL